MPYFVGQSDARMVANQQLLDADWDRRRILHDQRMRDKYQREAAAANDAEMAQRERMQMRQIAADQASQAFAADRRSSDEYNARNDAYSAATDPRLAAIERLRLNEAADRSANLIGTQGAVNRMGAEQEAGFTRDRDQRLSALKQDEMRLGGEIDSGRLAQQHGQNMQMQAAEAGSARSLAELKVLADRGNLAAQGRINMFLQQMQGDQAMDRDRFQAGATEKRDQRLAAYTRDRDNNLASLDTGAKREQDFLVRERELQDRWAMGQQQGWQFNDPDKQRLAELEQEKGNIEHARQIGRVDEDQYWVLMHRNQGERARITQTKPIVTFGQQFDQQSRMLPDGRLAYNNGKGISIAMPAKTDTPTSPEQIAEKKQAEFAKRVDTIAKGLMSQTEEDVATGQKKPRFKPQQAYQIAHDMAVTQDGNYDTEIPPPQPSPAEPGDTVGLWRDMLGNPQMPPTDQRARVMDQTVRDERSAPPERPMVGQNMRTGTPTPPPSPAAQNIDAMTQRSVESGDQQTAGALQAFKAITQKYGGMPPAGSEEERIVMQAAAFLRQRGVDPTGGVRRPVGRVPYGLMGGAIAR